STELEPEFPAISPDGKKAFVTLQEANAFAVVDLTAPPKIIDIVPLGFKNHSKGQPQLSLFPFNGLPNLGHDANGLSIKLGGFSGLAFEGQKNKNVLSFITVPDRGPNGGEVVGGARTFNLPNYQARIVRFDINTKSNNAHVINGQTIFLTRAGGIPITGLPNVPGFDEVPVDAAGNSLSYDPFGADLEGIVRDPKDNTFWMVDEYRPSIYHFDNKGKLITRLVPEGTTELSPAAVQAAAHRVAEAEIVPGFYGDETLPEVYNTHRTNRGFEAVALDPENRILYAFIQSPLENPDRDQRTSSILRILGVDINSASDTFLQPVKEYVYLLERPAHALDTGVDKIGDAVYAGNGKFLVIERDSSLDPKGKKYVFEVHLKGATNIRELAIADETDPADSDMVNTLEELTPDELADQGIIPVSKIKVLNLPSIGYTQSDKPEGIALLPDGKIAVLNDNDFGIEEAEGLIPVVGLISFNDGNKLDASNSDGGINIRNWPVFGMYQPDSIDAYDVNGMTFYVTANEGDSRVFDFFSEERRIGAVSVVLDPDVFPPALNLKNNANLGRLNITNILGDTDGDGDFDKLFAYGARSFSIWDTFGNLVYDSSDDLEEITAALLPDDFNSTNNANSSFDSRSDDKGPEPEGVVTGVVNGKTFAFIGLERIGGVMVYDITDPYNPVFVDYFNNRNFTVQAQNPDNSTNSAVGDLGPEGLEFVPASDSPNGIPLLIVGNEVSGTTTVYEVNAE
ncbi:MAG: choice-of-anchor I family protein, partial [Thermodesulfobacteriota bacterium]